MEAGRSDRQARKKGERKERVVLGGFLRWRQASSMMKHWSEDL